MKSKTEILTVEEIRSRWICIPWMEQLLSEARRLRKKVEVETLWTPMGRVINKMNITNEPSEEVENEK